MIKVFIDDWSRRAYNNIKEVVIVFPESSFKKETSQYLRVIEIVEIPEPLNFVLIDS